MPISFVLRVALMAAFAVAPGFANNHSLANQNGAISVVPISYALEDSAKVGTVKAGLFCGPKGVVRWGDIKLPRDRDVELELSNLLASVSNDVTYEPFKLEGHVTHFKIKLCVPGLGIGERKTKGAFSMTINWSQTFSSPARLPKSSTIMLEESLENMDPRRDSGPVRRAIVRSAQVFLSQSRVISSQMESSGGLEITANKE